MSVPYKLEEYDINALRRQSTRKSTAKQVQRDIIGIIEEFIAGNYDCCRVCVCDNDRKAHFECTILRRTVKVHNYENVKVVLRGDKVYLVKKNKWEEIDR